MPLLAKPVPDAIPLRPIEAPARDAALAALDPPARAWTEAMGFAGRLGEVLPIPGEGGRPRAVLVGWGDATSRARGRFHLAAAHPLLPAGRYALEPGDVDLDHSLEALGWLLAEYGFDRYRQRTRPARDLVCPAGADRERITIIAGAARLAQDLINTPARDLGPEALEAAVAALAARHGAELRVTRGAAELHAANLPMIAAVGAAAAEPPRLLDMAWGRADAPQVVLAGKGVCFDTGGLDIKPAASMALMKKDMGGAANAMALAEMVMALGLDLRLRLLVPAVENAISAPAMRPGDVLTSRKGLSVEVNNTDAEGRLVLADALALADEEDPDLVLSLATLTGAARVALGPDVPPYFTDDETLAAEISRAATATADPLWRLPFWTPYEELIEPDIADLDNAPGGGMAGAITAALFLRRFVSPGRAYAHFDIYGWTPKPLPARPKGGACQAARALLDLLEARYCRTT